MCNHNGSVIPVTSSNLKNLNSPNMMFHCLSCPAINGDKTHLHNQISLSIHKFLSVHGDKIISQTEEQYICFANGEKHKVDITVITNKRNKETTFYIDVNTFNCGCSSNSRVNNDSSLARMIHHENAKISEYAHVQLNNCPTLIPFIIDSSGNLGLKAINFIKAMEEFRHPALSKTRFTKAFKACLSACFFSNLNSVCSSYFNIIDDKIAQMDTNGVEVDNLLSYSSV